MQKFADGASCARRKEALGMMVLGLVVLCGCDCKSRPSGPVAPDTSAIDEAPAPNALAPDAPVAPRWHSSPVEQPERSAREMPSGENRPAYGLPLDIKIENVPQVPPQIKGPLPDKKKTLRWFSF